MSGYIFTDDGEPFMRIEDAVKLLSAPPERQDHDWVDRMIAEIKDEAPRSSLSRRVGWCMVVALAAAMAFTVAVLIGALVAVTPAP